MALRWRRPAPGGRALATGVSVSATLGMVAAMAAGVEPQAVVTAAIAPEDPAPTSSTLAATIPEALPVEVAAPTAPAPGATQTQTQTQTPSAVPSPAPGPAPEPVPVTAAPPPPTTTTTAPPPPPCSGSKC